MLRPYQVRAVTELRAAFASHRRVLLQAPTGAGKTIIFRWLAMGVAERHKRVLVLAHRKVLIGQASDKLAAADAPHGVIDAKTKGVVKDRIVVASVQTLVRRLHLYPDAWDLIIVDEAHHSVAGTHAAILAAYPKAYLLGVTATPERHDGRGLQGHYDAIVLGPSVHDLIMDGYLAEYVAYGGASAKPDLSKVHTLGGDYKQDELEQAMDQPKLRGDLVEHYRRHADGLPAVVFGVTVNHAEHIAAEFRAAGYRAVRIDGTTDDESRDAAIRGLDDGSVQVLCNCALFDEGLDVPGMRVLIDAKPTKSLSQALQKWGRVLRPKPDGTKAIILDHAGNLAQHGFPCQPREWSLAGKQRKKKEPEVTITTCPGCYANLPGGTKICPHCGEVLVKPSDKLPPEPDHSTLVELRPPPWATEGGGYVNRDRRSIDVAVKQCRGWNDLKALERRLGFRRGWAHHVARGLGWEPVISWNGYTTGYIVHPQPKLVKSNR